MKTTLRKIRTSFISAAALLFAVPFAAQAITVDGQYNDWNLESDFSMPKYRAGDSNPDFSGHEILSNAYLRYDGEHSQIIKIKEITVDGQYNDWNLESDFSMPKYRAGDSSPDFSEILSSAYLRYDGEHSQVIKIKEILSVGRFQPVFSLYAFQ